MQCVVCFHQNAETGGIPLRVLRQQLNNQGVSEELPADKVEYLIQKADRDQDGHLDYEEFINLVKCRDSNE